MQNTISWAYRTTKPYMLSICVQPVFIVEEVLELNQCFILVCGWQTHYNQQITQYGKHNPHHTVLLTGVLKCAVYVAHKPCIASHFGSETGR